MSTVNENFGDPDHGQPPTSSRPLVAAPPVGDPIDPVEAFAPFNERETRILRRYVSQFEKLVSSSFVRDGKLSLSFSWKATSGGSITVSKPGDEAVRAFLLPFRTLYLQNGASFRQVLALLRRHAMAKGTAESALALRVLDHFGREYTRILQNKPRPPRSEVALLATLVEIETDEAGNEIARRALAPREVIDTYLNGEEFHWDEEHARRLARWRPETFQWAVLQAIWACIEIYSYLETPIVAVLEHERLVSNSEATTAPP